METCILQITGTNPSTKKPYSDAEKIAICKAQLFSDTNEYSQSFADAARISPEQAKVIIDMLAQKQI